jgi:hypothetical protein
MAHYWKTRGCTHIANAVSEYGTTIFIETPMITSYRWMREPVRNAGTWRSRTSINSTSPRWSIVVDNHLLVGTGKRDSPDFCSRLIRKRKPAMEVLHGSDEPGDPGLDTGPILKQRATAADRSGFPDRTIRKPDSIFSVRAIPHRDTPGRAVPVTTSLRVL